MNCKTSPNVGYVLHSLAQISPDGQIAEAHEVTVVDWSGCDGLAVKPLLGCPPCRWRC